MAKALTVKAIEAATGGKDRRELPDGTVKGLYLVVQPSGVKGWAIRYRHAGKPCKLTLGRYQRDSEGGGLSLADARTAAGVALEQVERGINPAVEKKATKAARLEAELEGRDKIKNLLDLYERRHLSSLRSGDQARAFLDRDVLREWGERDVHSIKKRDVIDLLDNIVDSGRSITANRVLAHLRAFLNWCVERDVLEFNPATSVKPPVPEVRRDRVLSDDEIRLFWQACDAVGQPFGPMGKLLLLTGQRRGEVSAMTDGELAAGKWNLPKERTKNKRPHTLPLSSGARATLSGLVRVKSDKGYLFTTNGKTPVSGFSKAHTTITDKMAELAGEDAEIEPWRWHDLRRTCATGLARLGVPVRVTEAVLNHVSGTGGGIVEVYQRHDYAAEKAEALELWSQAVADIVAGRDPIEARDDRQRAMGEAENVVAIA